LHPPPPLSTLASSAFVSPRRLRRNCPPCPLIFYVPGIRFFPSQILCRLSSLSRNITAFHTFLLGVPSTDVSDLPLHWFLLPPFPLYLPQEPPCAPGLWFLPARSQPSSAPPLLLSSSGNAFRLMLFTYASPDLFSLRFPFFVPMVSSCYFPVSVSSRTLIVPAVSFCDVRHWLFPQRLGVVLPTCQSMDLSQLSFFSLLPIKAASIFRPVLGRCSLLASARCF